MRVLGTVRNQRRQCHYVDDQGRQSVRPWPVRPVDLNVMVLKSAMGVAATMVALFVAELILLVYLADRFGLLAIGLLALSLSVVGLRFLIRYAPGLIVRTIQDVAEDLSRQASGTPGPPAGTTFQGEPPATDQRVADRALMILAAGLLSFPGLLTGGAGLLLFVQPVRALLASSLGSRLSSLLPAGALDGRSFQRRRDIVDVTSTIKDPARPPASTARPELP